jgi:hypothetical protein
MKFRYLNSVFLILLLCLSAYGQSQKTTIASINVGDDPYSGDLQIILASSEKDLEITISERSFDIPDRFLGEEKIRVKMLIGRFDLDFGQFEKSHFGQKWRILIETRPFSEERVEGLTAAERRKLKLVCVVTFESGGQMVFRHYRD